MKRIILPAAVIAALALAPAAWAHDGEAHEGHEAMEGMQHEGMHAMSSTAKDAPTKNDKKGKKAKKGKKHSKEGKAMETKKFHYVCPMHDGGESDKPGPCPKCGMDLVKEGIGGDGKSAETKAAKPAGDHESMHEHMDGKGRAE